MRPGVVSDLVARLDESADDAAPLVGRDRLADREERATAAVALERLGDRLGPRGRAVVEGQRDDLIRDPAPCLDELHASHSTRLVRCARVTSRPWAR